MSILRKAVDKVTQMWPGRDKILYLPQHPGLGFANCSYYLHGWSPVDGAMNPHHHSVRKALLSCHTEREL